MPFINLVVSHNPDDALARSLIGGVTERTHRILRKRTEVIAVALSFVPPARWAVGGQTLEQLGLSSFWLDIKVTDGTNTKDEKAAYLGEIYSFMREVLGPLHEVSYVLVHEVLADAWAYGGVSQEHRYVRAKLEAATIPGARG